MSKYSGIRPETEGEKVCVICNKSKSMINYYINPQSKSDGRYGRCIPCYKRKQYAYEKKTLAEDEEKRLLRKIRGSITRYVKGNGAKTIDLINCSTEWFSHWIAFNIILDGIQNEIIEIDHVRPLSKNKEDETINHWTNLYPLIRIENREKSAKEPSEEYIKKVEERIRQFRLVRFFD